MRSYRVFIPIFISLFMVASFACNKEKSTIEKKEKEPLNIEQLLSELLPFRHFMITTVDQRGTVVNKMVKINSEGIFVYTLEDLTKTEF